MLDHDISAASTIAGRTDASGTLPLPTAKDEPLERVAAWFGRQASFEAKIGAALRQSIDEVLDGQRTGRFDINTLEKTEKTYLGTKVEIVIRSTFNIPRGGKGKMDYLIDNQEVDSKFTIAKNWTIPREADGHICLLISADEYNSSFKLGLIRIHPSRLNAGKNRDGKRTLSAIGRSAVAWLVPKGALPANILLSLSPTDRNAIFNASAGYRGSGNGGQLRTNELFRRVQERLVDRNTVLTVASQDDSPKRVRDARKHLRPEGIIILGHQGTHPAIARSLGLPVPEKGSWVAARVSPTETSSGGKVAHIDHGYYTLALKSDPISAAPLTH